MLAMIIDVTCISRVSEIHNQAWITSGVIRSAAIAELVFGLKEELIRLLCLQRKMAVISTNKDHLFTIKEC